MKSGLKKIISDQFPIGAAESMLQMPQVPNCTCIKVPHFLTQEGQTRLHQATNLMATLDKRGSIRNKGSLSSTKPIR